MPFIEMGKASRELASTRKEQCEPLGGIPESDSSETLKCKRPVREAGLLPREEPG